MGYHPVFESLYKAPRFPPSTSCALVAPLFDTLLAAFQLNLNVTRPKRLVGGGRKLDSIERRNWVGQVGITVFIDCLPKVKTKCSTLLGRRWTSVLRW
jgi:hypothetical protein